METGYDGRQVVGMDLHRRRSVLVRMTEDGRRLGKARITNSPAELRREIARAGTSPRVVLEATYGWYWAADTLAAAGAEVHLARPPGVKAFSCHAKTRTADGQPRAEPERTGIDYLRILGQARDKDLAARINYTALAGDAGQDGTPEEDPRG